MSDRYNIHPTGTPCAFWDDATPHILHCAAYSHTEVTTPFHRHWTTDGDYYEHCKPVGSGQWIHNRITRAHALGIRNRELLPPSV